MLDCMTAQDRSPSVTSSLNSLSTRVTNLENKHHEAMEELRRNLFDRINSSHTPSAESGVPEMVNVIDRRMAVLEKSQKHMPDLLSMMDERLAMLEKGYLQSNELGVSANSITKKELEESSQATPAPSMACTRADTDHLRAQMRKLETQMKELESQSQEFRTLSLALLSRINDDCVPRTDRRLAQLEEKNQDMERALKELNPNLKHGSTAFNANSFTPSKDAYSVQQGVFAKEDRESSQVGMFTIVGTQQTLGTTSAPQLQAKKLLKSWMASLGNRDDTATI